MRLSLPSTHEHQHTQITYTYIDAHTADAKNGHFIYPPKEVEWDDPQGLSSEMMGLSHRYSFCIHARCFPTKKPQGCRGRARVQTAVYHKWEPGRLAQQKQASGPCAALQPPSHSQFPGWNFSHNVALTMPRDMLTKEGGGEHM